MRRFRRFLGLPGRMKWLLAESIFLLAAAIVAVALMPFSALQFWVTRKSNLKARGNFSPEEISWAVSVAGRFLPSSTCLAQALAMQLLMQRCGYDPVIRVGVRKREDGELTAHAWVECKGQVAAGGSAGLREYCEMSVFSAPR